MSYLTAGKNGVPVICLHIQPNASKSRIVGLHDGCLKLAVASPPVDGKANKEVLRFLADLLDASPRQLVIKRGLQSRRKQVAVHDMTEPQIQAKLDALLALSE